DGQAQTQSGRVLAVTQTTKLLEDDGLIRAADTWPGIPHTHQQFRATPAAANQHPTVAGITHGVGEEILQDPSQKLWVGLHPLKRIDAVELEVALAREQ